MTTSMQSNIGRNKSNMSILGNQYSTGKKIQRPSEDPTIAVRSLKFRTQLSELNQYYEKNIPDALSWMDVTESALKSANQVLQYMNTYCNQGANDTLEVDDRNSIIATLKQYKEQIYQYANTDYAGRYVFTGFRTDTPLVFNENTSQLRYTITEEMKGSDITALSYVYQQASYVATNTAEDYAAAAPTMNETHRLRLAYSNCDNTATSAAKITFSTVDKATGNITTTVINGSTAPSTSTVTVTAPDGSLISTAPGTFSLNKVALSNPNAYNPAAGTINYIPETGELIISDSIYAQMKFATNISVDYDKTNFAKGDVRPEHYFACKTVDPAVVGSDISYSKPNDQNIQYEINFSQKLTVNTLASNSFSLNIGRQVDEILSAASDLEASELKLSEVNKMIAETTNPTQLAALNELKSQLDTEIALKKRVLQTKFGNGITMTTKEQERINIALSDHGSRYVRLEMVESRLSDQQVDFKDMLAKNDSVNLEDIIIDYNAAEVTYNASLAAAGRVVTNTLLDYLR